MKQILPWLVDYWPCWTTMYFYIQDQHNFSKQTILLKQKKKKIRNEMIIIWINGSTRRSKRCIRNVEIIVASDKQQQLSIFPVISTFAVLVQKIISYCLPLSRRIRNTLNSGWQLCHLAIRVLYPEREYNIT